MEGMGCGTWSGRGAPGRHPPHPTQGPVAPSKPTAPAAQRAEQKGPHARPPTQPGCEGRVGPRSPSPARGHRPSHTRWPSVQQGQMGQGLSTGEPLRVSSPPRLLLTPSHLLKQRPLRTECFGKYRKISSSRHLGAHPPETDGRDSPHPQEGVFDAHTRTLLAGTVQHPVRLRITSYTRPFPRSLEASIVPNAQTSAAHSVSDFSLFK